MDAAVAAVPTVHAKDVRKISDDGEKDEYSNYNRSRILTGRS